ncbi:50S ribosomal subunit protein L33 [Candidatus Zinderia insecticola CARI]|uniref:Large ribosomal subunit protein bL33 n=1 Tax=Zinderia insecticola (strain CARI) TaxID=871271 RepID=E0TJ52_ZINIC|nr:50S ribosomal subunit protein L33 [Candidatus Zinderia insecticola CARI]
MKKKKNRKIIKLVSTSGSKHFYTTTKSKKLNLKKLNLKKFDPKIKKHIKYIEENIK